MKRINLLVSLTATAGLLLSSCAEHPPDRDQIPVIKDQISQLESFYLGTWDGNSDSLMTQDFYADMGGRGTWQAIAVGDEIWPFIGYRNRSFSYSKTDGVAELNFLYRSPDSLSDSLRPAKVFLKHANNIWKISDVKAVEPITY